MIRVNLMKHLRKAALMLGYLGGTIAESRGQVTLTNISHINNGGEAHNVALSGNYAYLANGSDGLRIYDISNPTNPFSAGHINSGASAFAVVIATNHAYVANFDDGLRIYDVSNPTNPVTQGHAVN